MSRKILLVLLAGAVLAAALWAWQAAQPPRLPNPASVHCVEQGGTLDIRKDADGNEIGVCVFDIGHECEEWALFQNNQCVAP